MNRFKEEVRVIPGAVWLITAVAYGLFVALLWTLTPREMPALARCLFSFGLPLIFSVFVLLAGYVYGDAKRRGMRALMWMLLALLIPNAIGFILYFIMREPLMTECPQCNRLVRGQFAFCPYCGANRGPSCPQCRRAVQTDWPHCPHCGTSLSKDSATLIRDAH